MSITLHKIYFVLLVHIIFLGGCVQEGAFISTDEFMSAQAEEITIEDASMVIQTLEPAPKEQISQSPSNLKKPMSPSPSAYESAQSPLSQSIETNTSLATSEGGDITPAQLTGKIFGEFTGIKTQWEEKKQHLAAQLHEQKRKKEELELQFRLIEQIAENVSFMTKAYVVQSNYFLMEFSIENRSSYAIKDFSITCEQVAPTGTIIQSHTETIYAILQPATRSTYLPIPYGNKHRQTQAVQCQITNFTIDQSRSTTD